MLQLKNFNRENYKDYQDLYNEFILFNSDLIPDVLELSCESIEDYENILSELNHRLNGNHEDSDWYKDGHYYLVYDNNKLIGLGCIRNNLTQKGFDIWGNIAYGVRPSERKKGYATKILKELIKISKELGIECIIVCHYEENEITPKILKKVKAKYLNEIVSPYSNKLVKRYQVM